MFDNELALLNQRYIDITKNLALIDFSSSPVLDQYFRLMLEDLRLELSEINDDMGQMNLIEKASITNKTRYYKSLSIKIGTLRTMISAVDRDMPISKLVLNQALSPEYILLERMVKESLGEYNPSWILCLWDDFKCLLPRPALRTPGPDFSFIICPESSLSTPLIYPILFHEVGHAALSSSSIDTGFSNLNQALDRVDESYIFRTSNAGGNSKRKLISEWNQKRYWDMWGRELFCDYYALMASGPSYLHAMVTYLSGTYPYDISPTHPPMQLRLDFMLNLSSKMGLSDPGFEINKSRWEMMKKTCAFDEIPKYRLLNDSALTDALIMDAQRIVKDIGIDKRNYWTIENHDLGIIGHINAAWESVLNKEKKIDQANSWVISRHLVRS